MGRGYESIGKPLERLMGVFDSLVSFLNLKSAVERMPDGDVLAAKNTKSA